MVKVGDFEFDVDLLISLLEARPVLWDKTVDIYKDRTERKKAWREVCIRLQEDFEALGNVQKTLFLSFAIIFRTQLIEIHTDMFFFISYTLIFIFLTFARKQLEHLLENSQLLYSIFLILFAVKPPRTDCLSGTFSRPVTVKASNHLSREQNCAEQHWP